jgi:hypothetical protein
MTSSYKKVYRLICRTVMNVATLTSTQHRLSLAQRTYDRVFDAAYTVPQTEQVVSGTIVSAAGCGEDGISTLLCPRVVFTFVRVFHLALHCGLRLRVLSSKPTPAYLGSTETVPEVHLPTSRRIHTVSFCAPTS